MYRQLEKWDDAKRVAKTHGGKAAFEKVVLAQAHTVFKVSILKLVGYCSLI